MDSERIKITIDVFDELNQLASVRSTLLVRDLIAEIQREFDLDPGNYTLHVKESDESLDPDRDLAALGVSEGDALVFGRQQYRRIPTGARLVSAPERPSLQEVQSGRVFEIDYTPAVIGRPYNQASASALAIPIGKEFAEFRSVSRNRHAQLIEQEGQYLLESLKANNLACVNGAEVAVGAPQPLQAGDRVRIGNIEFVFKLGSA